MHVNVNDALKGPEYDFLRSEPKLKDNLLLLTTGGSIAYGTNTKNSDIDIRGVFYNSRFELLTMKCCNKPFIEKETDTVIYPLQQIKTLLCDANPNVIEMFGTKEEHIFEISKYGKLLRGNINLFLSKRVAYSFGGYATSQLRRLQNALARDSYPQAEKEMHILNSIKNQMYSFEERYQDFTKEGINLYLDKSEKEDFDDEIFMDLSLKHYPMRDFKAIYAEMSNVLRNYESLNHRNNKKDDLHLNKHAMHLIRLLIMGTEILEGKGINTYREKEHELLMSIRNGDLVTTINGVADYSEIFALVDEYEKKFQYAAENTELPDRPDDQKVDELIAEINLAVVSGRI